MSRFNGSALRLLSILGVLVIILILLAYNELITGELNLSSSIRMLSFASLESPLRGTNSVLTLLGLR